MSTHYLVTGGAGFIGSNYVARLLSRGEKVTVFDNLSRQGAKRNIEWLWKLYGKETFRLIVGDVRDAGLITDVARDADIIVHLAGQVAVTTSVMHPREDFEQNALGTFNVLEAARYSTRDPIVLYASTNKVYGSMENEPVLEEETRYRYKHLTYGVPESYPLDLHSPYGCSKGAGDQYTRDYHRIYGLRTVVFRQSCIYGPRQFGIEDQGWLAWFLIAAILQKPITIYGNGKQVRDVLFIEDLLDAYDAAIMRIEQTAGQIYNIGGGPQNTLSIWREFKPILEGLIGREVSVSWGERRPGDQKIYISDIRKAANELEWKPQVDVETGIRQLYKWISKNKDLFQ